MNLRNTLSWDNVEQYITKSNGEKVKVNNRNRTGQKDRDTDKVTCHNN